MRSAIAGPVTPLLGSLGLHGGLVLALLIAVHRAAPIHEPARDRLDAWAGNAVEVDAVATPDATASVPSNAPATAADEATEATEAREQVATPRAPTPDRPTPKPVSAAVLPAVPRPSKRTHTADSPAATAASAATPADAASGTGAAAPATGAFGSEGLPPGVRSLPSAFTRAIPPGTGADPIWQTLAIGSEHPFTIAIEVDADGHIASAELVPEKDGTPAATQAARLRERVVALLGGGLFALQTNVGAGRELFRVTITLSDTPVHEEDDPAQLVERGFEPPRGSAPGRAYFTLASGRHFEAKVQVLPRR